MNLYELNTKSKIGRQKCFIFNQINNLIKEIDSSLENINICYYLK